MAEVARLPAGTQELTTLDVQPLTADSVVVMVTGKIVIEGEANALATAQAFVIVNAGGAPFVSNQVFRFNYGAWQEQPTRARLASSFGRATLRRDATTSPNHRRPACAARRPRPRRIIEAGPRALSLSYRAR